MGHQTPTATTDPGVAPLRAHLDAVCALLREASGESFQLITEAARTGSEATELAPGWSLTGGGDRERRQAAAELLGRVLNAEREIESLCAEILDRYEEVTLVQRLGLELARAMDEDGLALVVVRAVTEWLHARTGEIWLTDGDGTRLAAAVPDDHSTARLLGEVGPLEALAEGTEWTQGHGCSAEAVAAIPIPGDGAALGVLVVRGKCGNRSFEQREIQLLTAVAALASGFLRSHRLARTSWLDEHEGSKSDITRLLHPRRELNFQGLEFSCACRTGQQTGADYHDVVRTPGGGLALSLARVSIGGTRAAMHMAVAKGVLQAEARAGSSPSRMLRRVNDVLSPELIRSDLFATAYVAHFHPGGRRVDIANAGYSVPLLVRGTCAVEEIDMAGPALGLLSVADYDEGNRDLMAGDVLIFHSDGLADARSPLGNGLEIGSLGELVTASRGATAEQIRDRLLIALDAHRDGRALEQDATLIVVRVV